MKSDAIALVAGCKIAPYRLIDLTVCKDMTMVDSQKEQNLIFFQSKFYFLLVQKNFSTARTDLKIGKG